MRRRQLLASLLLPAHAAPRPRMMWADESRLGRPFAKDPSVIEFQNRFLLYYSLPGTGPRGTGWGIGIAHSTDLIQWHKAAEILPQQDCEQNGICAPGARVIDGRVHLFYQTYGNGRRDAICHAESADGLTFQRHPANPVFRPAGDWHAGRAIDADIIQFRGRWHLYAATRDPDMKVQMILGAVAEPGRGFGPDAWKPLAPHPLLKPELPWERDCIEAPTTLIRNGKLYMFYAGGYNNAPQQIGCAMSDDGIAWRRLFPEPLLPNGAPGSWNSSESGHPGVLVTRSGKTHLFFQGNPDRGKTWWLSQVELGWRNQRPYVR
jgi:sucrose-6-phosphate hydrolase SacC (GH32 family)